MIDDCRGSFEGISVLSRPDGRISRRQVWYQTSRIETSSIRVCAIAAAYRHNHRVTFWSSFVEVVWNLIWYD